MMVMIDVLVETRWAERVGMAFLGVFPFFIFHFDGSLIHVLIAFILLVGVLHFMAALGILDLTDMRWDRDLGLGLGMIR
jgi:hypothetical protein